MPWLQLKLDTRSKQAEPISDLLNELGAAAVTFEDASEQPLFEPDPGETPLWDSTRIIGLFDAECDMPAIMTALSKQIDLDQHHCHVDPLEDKDWEREWMDNFKPIRFGERLWICPSWHTPDNPNAINVMLDPGLAFGTGTHPTTALCLQWLDQHDISNLDVIDFGCGSGILAIAAALLQAKHVIAVDHDPQAILASNDNALKNHVEKKVDAMLASDFEDKTVDLLLANILANPILELAPRFATLVKPGGHIVLSGILAEQADAVLERYQSWFEMAAIQQQGDWVRLDGQRR